MNPGNKIQAETRSKEEARRLKQEIQWRSGRPGSMTGWEKMLAQDEVQGCRDEGQLYARER